MKMRKYNYTGRKRINKEDFVLSMHSVSESNNSYFEFEIEESITSKFNPASNLVLEAYHRSTFMRFDWGKVNNLKPAKDRYLNAFTDPELIQFRIKIISELGMIEALADQVKPESDKEKSYSQGILAVQNTDLEGSIWEIEFDEDDNVNPLLKIDTEIDKNRLNHNIQLKASILPRAFHAILTEILFFSDGAFDFTTEEKDTNWRSRWWLFCEKLDRKLSFDEVSGMTEEDKKAWIDATVAFFSRKMNFKNDLLDSLLDT